MGAYVEAVVNSEVLSPEDRGNGTAQVMLALSYLRSYSDVGKVGGEGLFGLGGGSSGHGCRGVGDGLEVGEVGGWHGGGPGGPGTDWGKVWGQAPTR